MRSLRNEVLNSASPDEKEKTLRDQGQKEGGDFHGYVMISPQCVDTKQPNGRRSVLLLDSLGSIWFYFEKAAHMKPAFSFS